LALPLFRLLSARQVPSAPFIYDAHGRRSMLTLYLKSALRRAHYEVLPDDGSFYGEIPGFPGVYANASTLEACRDELEEVLEEWILLRVARHLDLPVVDGISLRVEQAS
jgi:predicted RNase H-like HicB family nuclease